MIIIIGILIIIFWNIYGVYFGFMILLLSYVLYGMLMKLVNYLYEMYIILLWIYVFITYIL